MSENDFGIGREIKFRAWDGELGRMVFWSLNDLLCRFGDEKYSEDRKDCSPFFNWMRFTGLKDKNGKEIYEGDIVQPYANGQKLGVCFIDYLHVGFRMSQGSFDSTVNWYHKVEVIGNIFENKELLNDR